MTQDIRWQQRFENFSRAAALLADALKPGASTLSMLEKEGVVQRFEFTFELAWKTLKDFLESEGLTLAPITPRQILKEAHAAKILSDAHVWIDMLDHRNLLSHTYYESVFEEAVESIAQKYLAHILHLRDFLQGKVPLPPSAE